MVFTKFVCDHVLYTQIPEVAAMCHDFVIVGFGSHQSWGNR